MSTQVLSPALHEAVDGLIWHALDRAGLRLRRSFPRRDRSKANRITPTELHRHIPVDREHLERHRVLEGALERVPEVAARHQLDPDCLTRVLGEYVRDLLVAGQPHRFDLVPTLLRDVPCRADA